MKKSFLVLLLSPLFLLAQKSYQYSLSLNNVTNDQIHVTLVPPAIEGKEIKFSFPKIVPGTYSISDYGRFIENFNAYDNKGIKIETQTSGLNAWIIDNTKGISKIEYDLNDTYDSKLDNPIFEPAGSDIEKDSIYMLNLHCLLGYFQNKMEAPIELTVQHPSMFYGSTSLVDKDPSTTTDVFVIENYNEAVDNPIMYTIPDTAIVKVGTSNVLISVFSKKISHRAKYIATRLDSLLQAQGKYLGGKLPVENYSFLVYMSDHDGLTGGFGALEHPYSSVYFMPEMTNEQLVPQLYEVAAHEFFHIVTPLGIHSEEIQYFDYDQPKMSEHLWLYEGTTEYHAQSVQVKYNFLSKEEFLNVIRDKMNQAQFVFNDSLPFTELSKGCLDKYEKEYPNVYAKGALIAMCLDLKLLHDSKGNYGLLNLIQDLSKKYGKNKAFKDDELFEVITSLTNPSIEEFLKQFIAGAEKLPFKEYLNYAGVDYDNVVIAKQFSLGMVEIGYNQETKKLVVAGTKNMNDFGKKLGYHVGDEFLKINKTKISPSTFKTFRENWSTTVKEGDMLTIQVLRKMENGKLKKIKLSSPVFKSENKRYNILKFADNATEEQLKIRKAWLEPR